MSSATLPVSARFALWFSAWSAGRSSLDDTRDAIVAGDAAHDVVGVPGAIGSQPLIVALGLLRSHRAGSAGIALPVPGDLLGLAGPGTFNVDAVEAGEGVVLDDANLGLVPHRTGAGVVWTCHHAVSHRQLPGFSEAESSLRQALLRASGALADLDVARWRPEVADELMSLRRASDFAFPGAMAPRAVQLAALSTRCRAIVGLALEDDGAAITSSESDARRQVLGPLDHAARRGLVAACSPSTWPPEAR